MNGGKSKCQHYREDEPCIKTGINPVEGKDTFVGECPCFEPIRIVEVHIRGGVAKVVRIASGTEVRIIDHDNKPKDRQSTYIMEHGTIVLK